MPVHHPMMKRALNVVAAMCVVVVSLPAQELDQLEFMSGCWRGEYSPGRFIEEFYSTPSANLMVGTTRYLAGDVTRQFEFSRITRDETGIVLLPFPGGTPSEHAFRLTSISEGRVVFEAPEHDYPKRIIYHTRDDGWRVARIDGGEGDEGMEWPMQRVSCDP